MGRSNNMILITILLVAVIMFVFQMTSKNPGCNDKIECLAIGPNEPMRIGVIRHPSKNNRSMGIERSQIIKLALADRGTQIYKHPVIVHFKEIECSAPEGENAVNELIDEKPMLGILSLVCPAAHLSAAKFASKAGLVLMSGIENSPRPIHVEGQARKSGLPGYFRTIYNKAESGKAAASFAFRKLGVTKAAVYSGAEAPEPIYADIFRQFSHQFDGEVSSVDSLAELVANQPEFLFLNASVSENLNLIKGIKSSERLNKLSIFCSIDLLESEFLQSLGEDGRNIYFIESDRYNFSLESRNKTAEYQTAYGYLPQYSHFEQIYDAATILMLTIKASSLPRQNGNLIFGRQRLRDILSQTTNFKGLSGNLSCNSNGECGVSRFRILKIDDPQSGLDGLRQNVVFIYSSN
jgi:branched-chain amino acid transport system substrate-binding protein